ncbi:DNA topoisomerase-1 [Catalinimonas alkaloidigena]|uniref:type I DNA topoisomerase n=1 Tax=Catalinimonas alkaloidigena TaxID=1075417 RepID=UPI0024064B7D|nr:type I DNA topoisomerase [Catalinimonas alkaloidigena]MDF9796718.1 DNA topoisomerase-1 [Catalinimonas alkaloidigena]
MPKNLVIVESPAKAKTIEGYLGKDYVVASSYGHIRDLPKDDKAIDINNGFKPTYTVSSDKKEVISQLKKLVKDSDLIYLASDDDREGEAISWHLKEELKLKDEKTRRIVFREITKTAILNAIQTPRGIDLDLVNAQQARRILDRLVGFELSPVLWKKIKRGLSAGRVQSVAVRLVVEREREITEFESKSSYKVSAEFIVDKNSMLKAELPKKFDTEEEALAFLEACRDADFHIKKLEKKPVKKSPSPPFTTSTLQQEAARKLGFSVSQTMTLAQRLYEAGKISYMRTDSTNLSEEALQGASKEIKATFGDGYLHTRTFKTKSDSAQEAHEAIRPTDFSTNEAGKDRNEQRLYELIWKRAIASQMAEAQIERTLVTIAIDYKNPSSAQGLPDSLSATGEVVKFDGFLKVYIESTDDEENDEDRKGMLPPLTEGQKLTLDFMKARQGFTRHPPRYTEASLVKKLEEMSIGRPSTYAPTISTVQKRGYILKEDRAGTEREYKELTLIKKGDKIDQQKLTEITGTEKKKLFPTDIAMVVNDFLVEYFDNVIDYSFTARVEKEFDEIAQGKKEWVQMLDEFYQRFHSKVESSEQIDRSQVKNDRLLGEDPKTGLPVIARLGKFGPMVQLGEMDAEEKPKFASLRKGQFIETITLEEALELFKLPREVGEFEGETITANIGRFGPYVRHKNLFASIPKDEDPMAIDIDRAIELIEAKRKADAEKYIKVFDENEEVQVLKGRYGPYIKVGKKNVKIPKDKEPSELTLEECLELAEKAPEKKGRSRSKKK